MKRLLVLAALAAGLVVFLSGREPRRPNVVLVVVDTLRADALGCYDGSRGAVSPEIDALAREGVQFTSVTAPSSWTRPSIGALLTGQYPRTLGLYREQYDILPDGFVTLAEVLKASGYETVGITSNPNINRVFNFHQGFDRYVDSAVVWEWMKKEPGQRKKSGRSPLPDSQSIFGEMVHYARTRSSGRPVYMQILIMEVHEGWALVRPEFQQEDQGLAGVPPGYWDGVRQVSHDIGRFVHELVALPGWRDTLFIITSDHGQGLHDHPAVERSWGHGFLLYESHVRVPAIFYTPKGAPGPFSLARKKVDTPIRLLDLAPTVLDHLGLAPPPGIVGRSVLRLVQGDGGKPVGLPPLFVTETYYQESDKIAVQSREWRYIENRDGDAVENPVALHPIGGRENGRATNRIEERPDVARELGQYLRGWEASFPKRVPTQPAEAPSSEILDQLRGLGYVR